MVKTMHIINTNSLRIFNNNEEKFYLKKQKSKNINIISCLNHQLTNLTLGLCLLATCGVSVAQAEPVGDNTTGTNVTPNGDQFDIDGGTTSGENLFHSFEKFGLTKDQIANFMSNPNIRNILGRVTGGDASVINGLIQVTGGDSNLFLINPAGIIFGKDASLNLPASFTATTANGIQVGDFWFDALGSNNYSNLVGDANGFAFATDEPGSIVNAGNLSVSQGETINLVGGLVINTGTLEAPEGNINITAVPEKQLVKISPEGSLLSLGLPTDAANVLSSGAELVTPQALPELLTGGDLQQATDVEVADNGSIKLTGSDIEIPSEAGTSIASGNIDVSGNSGGKINVLGDKVGVVAGNIDASGTTGGGDILIGGDYKGQGEVSNASRTFIDSDSVITADAVASGNGGQVIAWADEVTAFYGDISATGGSNSGDGGFVEVSGKDSLIFEGDVNLTAINGVDGTLLLDPRNIRIVGNGGKDTKDTELNIDNKIDDNDDEIIVDDNPMNVLNDSDLAEEPEEGFTISIDRLTDKNVTLEATNNITFDRNTLVNPSDNNSLSGIPEFIGALLEDFNEETPAQDIPVFQSLELKVDPPEGETGTINIEGSFAVRDELTIENTNGDINIDLLLPDTVNFSTGSVDLSDTNTRGSIFVGIEDILDGIDPNNSDMDNPLRTGVGEANITTPQGNVNLKGGITLNADSDLTIEAQRFTATDPVTLQGNGGGGQPGRQGEDFDPDADDNRDANNLTGEPATYNIGVAYFGGDVGTDNPDPILDSNGKPSLPDDSDSAPNVKFTVSFPNSNSNTRTLPGDPNTEPGEESTAEINITLLDDVFFQFDKDGDFAQSGIEEPIRRFARIRTDGSIGGGSNSFSNNAFQSGLFDDNQIEEEESEVEFVAVVNPVDETQKASFCSEELNIASIGGSNQVKATCGEQALAFVFSQPTDKDGNSIEITEDLFPELLTGDEFINLDKSTSFEFLQLQNKTTGMSNFDSTQLVNNAVN